MKQLFTLLILITGCSSIQSQIVQVKDISSGFGTENGNPRELFDYNGTLFFRAANGQNSSEVGLWKSDGTENGTVIVKNVDFSTQPNFGNSYNFTPFNGSLYFTGGNTSLNNGTVDVELWKTDGTTQGTVRVRDLNPGGGSSNPNLLTVLNPTTLLFQANDGAGGMELWKTDGTNAGTTNITNFQGNANTISWMKKFGNEIIMGQNLYYLGIPFPIGNEIYKTNGEVGNNVLVTELRPDIYNGVDKYAVNALGTIFFIGDNGNTGWELFKTNGTAAGTVLVKDIKPGTQSSQIPYQIAELGNHIYFATNTNDSMLWKSDGTASGTQPIPLPPGVVASNTNSYVTAANGLVYFYANQGQTWDLYATDGVVTTKLLDCNASTSSLLSFASEKNFVAFNGFVYFAVDSDGDSKKEFWRTDGTPAGTVLVASLFTPLVNPQSVSYITVSNTKIFFAGTLDDGNELMLFDPSTLNTDDVVKMDPLTIYPNPSNGSMTIDYPFTAPATFSIFDLIGKEVLHGTVNNNEITTDLNTGIYLLTIRSGNNVYTSKIAIVK